MRNPAYYMIIILFLTIACNTSENQKQSNMAYPDFNISSAVKILEIADRIQDSQLIEEDDWRDLFESDGYKNYLIYKDSLKKKELIKEVMLTVFDDDNKATRDSLLALPVEIGPNYFKTSLVNNFNNIKKNFQEYKAFLENFDAEKVIKEADSLAKSYIPERDKSSLPKLYPVFMVSADADGQVMNNAIVIDLSLTYQLNHEGVVKFIAHEFHHNYRMLKVKQYEDPLMNKLNGIHQEGVADLIDKEKPPLESLLSLPKSLINIYNQDYLKAPENLKKLDSLSQLYFTNQIGESELSKQLNNVVRFGGHTIGIHMSFMIAEHKGKAVLIETYDQPVTFFELYNEVAINEPNAYVLSQEFINHIKFLE